MNPRPLVSILIPCFNADRFVGDAVTSALGQTYLDVEVVVVDDGSTDGSVDRLRAFGDRIRFESGPRKGACAARNRALELSRGEFIQFLDADDVLLPEKIERQLPPLVAGEADLVLCKGSLFGDGQPPRPKKRPLPPPENADPFVYCLSTGLSTEGSLHRRRCLEAVGGFRAHLPRAQEFDLHLRLAASGVRLRLVDQFLYRHRDHDGPRITRRKQPPDYMVKLLLELLGLFEGGPPYTLTPERRKALAAELLRHSIYAYRNGAPSPGEEGIERACRLWPGVPYPRGGWRGGLANAIGPLWFERLLKAARSARNRLWGPRARAAER